MNRLLSFAFFLFFFAFFFCFVLFCYSFINSYSVVSLWHSGWLCSTAVVNNFVCCWRLFSSIFLSCVCVCSCVVPFRVSFFMFIYFYQYSCALVVGGWFFIFFNVFFCVLCRFCYSVRCNVCNALIGQNGAVMLFSLQYRITFTPNWMHTKNCSFE